MKKDARRRMNMSALMVALLIMVASSVVHGAPFEYTYTSETLIIVIGELPSEPRVATEFTLRFTYPEELEDGYTQLFTDDPGRSVLSLSATCGDIRFEIYQFDRIQASVTVSGGIPVEWDFTAIQSYNSSDDSSSSASGRGFTERTAIKSWTGSAGRSRVTLPSASRVLSPRRAPSSAGRCRSGPPPRGGCRLPALAAPHGGMT